MFRKIFAACLIGAAAFAATGNVRAATVRPLMLDEIIDGAAIAFHGTCTGNRVERDAATNLIVTYTTFAVKDTIKGNVAAVHVIKQIGGTLADGEGLLVQGVPQFAEGEDYVVFLAGVSSLGFSSPVGLSQGRFAVQDGEQGKTLSNGADFRALTARMPQAALPDRAGAAGGPVKQLGLDAFKRMARTQAGAAE